MLEVPVYNTNGEEIEKITVDEACFGTSVNAALLKQAVVAYHAHQHQGTAATKGRSQKTGSGRKLFRQKGTGYARRGNVRTNIMRGGGVAFAKVAKPRKPRKDLPKKMRRRALDSAILAKILGRDLLVVDGLKLDSPKTKAVANVLTKLNINRSCLLTLSEHNEVLFKSARNLPDVTVRIAADLNAYDVATRQKMLLTREAMKALLERPAQPWKTTSTT